jgi:curved DNA-binding protein CbpA
MRKALKHLERLAGGASAEGAKHEQQALEKRMQEFLDARVGGDPYRILGLAPGAPKEEVRRAYFRLAKEFHPDRLSSVGPSLAGHPLAEKIFQLINEAYELLTDDTRRTVFDRGQDVQRQEGQVRQAMERRVRDEWMRKGESAVREGNYAVAREQFAQLLAADPENGPAIAHAAFVDYMLEAAGRHTSLAPYEKRFEAAEALRRGADLVHVLWGRMYKREGNPAQAMAHFQKAVERNPNCVEALREIRLARMRQEDEKPAGRAGLDLVGGILGRLRREK